jgi:hypothetical protein
MTTCLMVYIPASYLKSFNSLSRLNNRQFHMGSFTSTRTLSLSGILCPCFLRVARQP